MRTICVICFLAGFYLMGAQTSVDLSAQVTKASFQQHRDHTEGKRKLLTFKKKSAYFNPLNYVGAGLLFVYQNIFSEQIQANCNYQISCSQFTKLSIEQNGFVRGVLGGFNQWTECFAGALYEHPPAFRSGDNKIINYTTETTIK
ncbi:MAG: membrane protein insertion efficiency factor YidD [Bacteroidota bacterium]